MGFDFSDFANSYISDLKATLDNISMASLEAFWNIVELTRQEGGSVHFIGNGEVLQLLPIVLAIGQKNSN